MMKRDGARCDVALVDGDHDRDAARWDLSRIRRAAGRHTAVVVDDIHMGPGYAVAQEQEAGWLKVPRRGRELRSCL